MSSGAPHYLDACVLVKLACKEAGSDVIDEYVRTEASSEFYVTEFAFYEAFAVLKGKWKRGLLTDQSYSAAVYILGSYFEERTIAVDSDFKPNDVTIVARLRELVERHGIDYSDALQVYAVANGRWRRNAYESKTVLVTEDKGLQKAAEGEGLRVWKFPNGPKPG